MADTIVDAFVISLGLDASQFDKGQKKAVSDFKKMREAGGAAAQDLESYGKRAANSFASLRNEVVGLGLAFAGAKGLTDLVSNILTGDADNGRFARNIGENINTVSAWQAKLKEVGGTAQDARGSLQTMFQSIEKFRLDGNDPAMAPLFRALGVTTGAGGDTSKGPMATLLAIAENRTHRSRQDYVAILSRMGLSEPVINTLAAGRGSVEGGLNHYEALAGDLKGASREAQELQKKLADLSTALQDLARGPLITVVGELLSLTQNTDAANIAMPVFVGLVGAIGIAAATAYGPILLLAGAIALVVKGYEDWQKGDAWIKVRHGPDAPSGAAGKGIFGGLKQMWDDPWFSVHHDPAGGAAPVGAATPRGAGGLRFAPNINDLTTAISSRGIDPGTARGIAAGVMAEGGGLGMADNGAFGIGQWRGLRAQNLFAKYGKAPSLHDQLDFLVSELRGGDAGGSSVLGTKDTDMALLAYIWKFMRPQGAHNEHYMDAVNDVARGRRAYGGGARLAVPHNVRNSQSHTETHIGSVTVTTQATDASGIARDIGPAIKKRTLVGNANSGSTG